MAYRTWLRDAKHLCDLGPFGDELLWSKPYSEWERADKIGEKRRHWLRQPMPLPPELNKYLPFGLHDSNICASIRGKRDFVATFDWWNGEAFSDRLAWILEIDEHPGPWPVDLIFEECQYVRWAATQKSNGALRFHRPEISTRQDSRGHREIVRFGWAVQTENRLQIMFLFWSHRAEKRHIQEPVVLMIDCASVRVVNRCLPKLIQHYGPKVELLWNDAMNSIEFPHEEQLWACLDFGDYLEKRMEFHGLKAADLMPTQEHQPQ